MIPNKFMDTSDDQLFASELRYFDANNLYGLAMSQPLPNGGFRWLDPEDFPSTQKILAYNPNANKGCVLEVDLHYPAQLHKQHQDIALCPEGTEIKYDDLSNFSKTQFRNVYPNRTFTNYKSHKLSATLTDKHHVVLHVQTLALYLALGLRLRKIHKVLEFTQSAWLAEFIEKCTNNRQESLSAWEKAMWKLFCNACFGKTMENVRKFCDIKLCNSEAVLMKHMCSALFQSIKIISEDLQVVSLKKILVKINKPIYIGMIVLDLAKYHMYYFWYVILKPTFGAHRLILHMHDTDSFIFSLKNGAFLDAILKPESKLRDIIDFSNVPLTPFWKDFRDVIEELLGEPLSLRKNKPGYFKCEMNWNMLILFVGLRSKVYALKYVETLTQNDVYLISNKNVCKGVNKYAVRTLLDPDAYKESLFQQKIRSVCSYAILKRNQKVQLVKQKKIALASFDDKHYALCPVHSIPYGSVYMYDTHKCQYS